MITELQLELADGTAVHVRRLLPGDATRLQEGVRLLSDSSRIHRFHAGLSRLSATQLRYLVDVDQQHHLAWGAEDRDHPDDPGVAVVRCVALAHRPHVAEFAITVLDEYQGRGLGTLLMGVIALDAHDHGFHEIVGYVQVSNEPMLGLLARLGATRQATPEGTVEMALSVRDLASWPDNRLVQRLSARLPGWPRPTSQDATRERP